MSQSESIKAKIGFHEKLFFGAWAVLIALLGWMATHFQEASAWMIFGATSGMITAATVAEYARRQIIRLWRELENA